MASSIDEMSGNSQLQSLLGIHKEYFNNLLLLIKYYNDNKEVAALIVQLEGLKNEFNDVDLVVNVNEGSAKLNTPVSIEKIATIRSKISAIRNKIRE